MSLCILNVDDIEGTRVSLTVDDCPYTTQIPSARNHAKVAGVKLDEIQDLGCRDLQLDGVIDFDNGVWVTDGTAIVGHKERDSFRTSLNPLHFAEFVLQKYTVKMIFMELSWKVGSSEVR